MFPFPYAGQIQDRAGDVLGDPVKCDVWQSTARPDGGGEAYDWRGLLDGKVNDVINQRNRVLLVQTGPHAAEYRVVTGRFHAALNYTEVELKRVLADG